MALVQLKREKRTPATIYEDNYGYTHNYYKPMIDYLDAKQKGKTPQYPHLPLSYERCMRKYQSNNSVNSYSIDQLTQLSIELSRRARKAILDQRVIKRSPFSVIKSAAAARCYKHIGIESVVDRTLRRQRERREESDRFQAMEDLKLMRSIKNYQDERKDVQLSESVRKAIRGKTSNQIKDVLLAESLKNIRNNADFQTDTELIDNMCSKMRHQRASSECRSVVRKSQHFSTVMDNRIITTRQIHSSCNQNLSAVQRELQNFNTKTNEIISDSRCG